MRVWRGAWRRAADALERGRAAPWAGARLASLVYERAAAARLDRDARRPRGPGRVVAVFGATLGGSWRTPLALALAEALAGRGLRVGFVAHGYGGRASARGRLAGAGSDPREVGDEASLAARRLGAIDVPVLVGRARDEAWPALSGRCVVVDGGPGPPRASGLRVLALDGPKPWGAGACPPAGDLRAPAAALEASADLVVRIWDELDAAAAGPDDATYGLALPGGLGGASAGVVTAIARPERFVRALRRRGVEPRLHVELADHAGPGAARALDAALARLPTRPDVLLTTEKCKVWLPARAAGVPLLAVPCALRPPRALVDRVAEALARA
ncbi:MAG TPA: tetraacyldisaccharide 4'-kinase [Polyangiaceae bacterium]|nr:tetraacyldisaccharide 4'-kinase [Polyangiaceae bacterium]